VTYNAGIIYDYPIAYYHDYPYTAPIVGPTATPLVSARFLRAVAAGGLLDVHATLWQGDTYLGFVPVVGGSVSVNGSQVGVRRTLTLETTADQWDSLSGFGLELRVSRGFKFVGGNVERVALGVFLVETVGLKYGATDVLTVTGADRFAAVQRAKFEQPETTDGTAVAEIARLGSEFFTTTVSTLTTGATSVVNVRDELWETDRADAIVKMCESSGSEAFFDRDGVWTVRNIPQLAAFPAWSVAAGEGGIMVGASKERNRKRAFSVVIVTAVDIDGFPPFDPVVVVDDDANSPTYVGGLFGRVPFYYSSPTLADEDQARLAGAGLLTRQRGNAAQVSSESVCNPALEAGDTIAFTFPDGSTELHLVEGFTVPLSVDGNQNITTRSVLPNG
jgi:hypothetical protein